MPSFSDLIAAELRCIRADNPTEEDAPQVTVDAEPRLTFCPHDTVGLSLSGGGIRSATFNLGLLEGLNSFGILPLVDYLSTVSGGGYIGGWWSAYLQRRQGSAGQSNEFKIFPRDSAIVEPQEVRHLREFSRFLAPRVGLFETEMWNAAVAYLAGLIPTFVLTTAMAFLAMTTFVLVVGALICSPVVSGVLLVVGCAMFQLSTENLWRKRKKGLSLPDRSWIKLVAGTSILTGTIYGACLAILQATTELNTQFTDFASYIRFVIGLNDDPKIWICTICFPAFFFAATGTLALTLVRPWKRHRSLPTRPPSVDSRARSTARDRIIGRLFVLSICWLLASAVWMGGCLLFGFDVQSGIWTTIAVWFASNGLFLKLRNWMFQALRPGKQAGWLDSLKPLLPMLLAYVALASGLVLLTATYAAVVTSAASPTLSLPLVVVISAVLVAIVVWFFHPQRSGLHAFYRRRIARAFLGASNFGVGAFTDSVDGSPRSYNQFVDELPDDDLPLAKLPPRPLHLICCAANTLGMDRLATLSRGSQSFTASRCALSLAGQWIAPTKAGALPTYGNYLTASAAAFNSNMGSASIQMGPAAAVLLCTANLRLGLWSPNPLAARPWNGEAAGGWELLLEMFSQTRTDRSLVHLSDGGHFENLGLYELVRRHCRYIITSDCGADPETKFDDLGNALRRIREDFGVEIEIDVSPLRPRLEQGNLAMQHVVVGTIHYDGIAGLDKGLLIYFKPNLTGDEPPDVVQYHARNLAFPNESTADQFYDEAQWEAYRRLGEHAAHSAFRFLEKMSPKAEDRAGGSTGGWNSFEVFPKMRWEWYPTPADLEGRVLAQGSEFSRLVEMLRSRSTSSVCRSMFPEFEFLSGEMATDLDSLLLITELLQFIESTWQRCRLESLENHPLNKGWLNQFARWVASPTFRQWWPFLKPLHSEGVVEYIEKRLDVGRGAGYFPDDWQTCIRQTEDLPLGLTSKWYFEKLAGRPPKNINRWYALEATLPGATSDSGKMQMAILGCQYSSDDKTLIWDWESLLIAPGMNSSGVGSEFLRTLIRDFAAVSIHSEGSQIDGEAPIRPEAVHYLAVNLKPNAIDDEVLRAMSSFAAAEADTPKRRQRMASDKTDAASRNRKVDEIAFYKSLGFVWKIPGDPCLIYDLTTFGRC